MILLRVRSFDGRVVEYALNSEYTFEEVAGLVSESTALNLPISLLKENGDTLDIDEPRKYELLSAVDTDVIEGF